MRRITPLIIALAVLLSVVGMRAPSAEAHAAYPGTWSSYYWIYYGEVWCSYDGRLIQLQERHQMWRVWDYNHGFWINHHDHFITSWYQQVGSCGGGA